MLSIGLISFQAPWVLLSFGVLPIIWFLIRALPPKPKNVIFPPYEFLLNLKSNTPPPNKAPWWVLLLRLLIAILIIITMADPVFNPNSNSDSKKPVLIVMDNGWEVAHRWTNHIEAAKRHIKDAGRSGNSIYILGTTEREINLPLTPLTPSEARDRLQMISPQAWSPSFAWTIDRLSELADISFSKVIWLTDALIHKNRGILNNELEDLGPLIQITDALTATSLALLPPKLDGLEIRLKLVRELREFPDRKIIVARNKSGKEIARIGLDFSANSERAEATLTLPQTLRNSITKLEVLGYRSAGTTYLMDGSATRPMVGITTGESALETPPLKSSRLYLTRALEGKAEVEEGDISFLLEKDISILILANTQKLTESEEGDISSWVDRGGVLIRFPGEQTSAIPDSLLPVQIRSGDRSFGGSLSWDTPKTLAPFVNNSPFAGLNVPQDIAIRRQLLASPSIELENKTWARLEDGTPIVTATTQNDGWLILFHTSANQDWSDLSLSGLFPAMLERLLPFANSKNIMGMSFEGGLLPPQSIMDGFGILSPPEAHISPLNGNQIIFLTASKETPPGLYGTLGAPVAVNLSSSKGPIGNNFMFEPSESGDLQRGFQSEKEDPLKPKLLILALLLGLLDMTLGLWLRGLVYKVALPLLIIGLALAPSKNSSAQESLTEDYALSAATKTRIAFVKLGNPSIDDNTLGGLQKLARIMRERTSLALDNPVAIDPTKDALNLYPLIYWPVSDLTPISSEKTLQKITNYLQSGGMILFDTGVGDPTDNAFGLTNPNSQKALNRLLGGMELPPLLEVGTTHVLSKSYYLLNQFPGRIMGRPLWAERRSFGEEPSVTGIIIGSHDWASAWNNGTGDVYGRPTGGFSNWQQEHSYRFGINLMMYALTGTYKNDNLHLDAILDRLVN